MRVIRLVAIVLLGMTFGSACGAVFPFTPVSQSLPSPEGEWTLTLRQTGGFVGVQLQVQVTSAGQLTATDERSGRTATQSLPAQTLGQLRQLMAAVRIPAGGGTPSACADCFIYDLTIKNGSGTMSMHADDLTLAGSGAADLITYLTGLRDSALLSQP